MARRLWESCAIPAILYCAEVCVFKKSTIKELERIQCMVGRFILQVPAATSRVMSWVDAGLMPLEHRIQKRQALFIWAVVRSKHNGVLIKVLGELLDNRCDPWVKSWMSIQRDIGVISDFERRQDLVKAMADRAVKFVMKVKRSHPSVGAIPQPWKWFQLLAHVNNSKASKLLSQIRGGNAQLGNRYRNRYGIMYELCPFCEDLGVRVRLGESHVVLRCPAVAAQRRALGVSRFVSLGKVRGLHGNQAILRAYLGEDWADKGVLLNWGRKLAVLNEAWMTSVHAGINEDE